MKNLTTLLDSIHGNFLIVINDFTGNMFRGLYRFENLEEAKETFFNGDEYTVIDMVITNDIISIYVSK